MRLKTGRRLGKRQRTDICRRAAQGMNAFLLKPVVTNSRLPRLLPVGKMRDEQAKSLPPEQGLIEHAGDRCRHVKTIQGTRNRHRKRLGRKRGRRIHEQA
ncbi:MAG: hypothetical protein CVU33_17660 [Betaproteobacteria bacterium HGW-Betaproteobacteria-6]|nr:MAG: hypothetical protein CVU33_17660 [Betaproteobacteria bacterium HGW-Betaproteobacteria-6]